MKGVSQSDSESQPVLSKKDRAVNALRKRDREKNRNQKIYRCICAMLCLFILISITIGSKIWINEIMEDREDVDDRNVYISERVHDYQEDPPKEYICTNDEPCKFKCEFVRKNLLEEKRACEYTDYLDGITTIFEILLLLGIMGCLCNKS